MSDTYCGARCEECTLKEKCRGCVNTCGSPFGGRCAAAEYIKKNGKEAYAEYKAELLKEINALMRSYELPAMENLFETVGEFVDLEYPLPNGKKAGFLSKNDVYLCGMTERGGASYGAVIGEDFVIVSEFGNGGAELLLYKKR